MYRFPKPQDLKVKRGLGILEELINEKYPKFFENQLKKKMLTQPRGIPIKDVILRLSP